MQTCSLHTHKTHVRRIYMSGTIIPFYSEFFPSYFFLKRDSIHRQQMTLLVKQTLYWPSHHGWITLIIFFYVASGSRQVNCLRSQKNLWSTVRLSCNLNQGGVWTQISGKASQCATNWATLALLVTDSPKFASEYWNEYSPNQVKIVQKSD